MELYLTGIAIIISLWSLYIARQAKEEVKTQALFSGFQQANQVTIEYPQLLKEVHGLQNISDEECRNIAYLSILMDAFQHEAKQHKNSTFLDKITSVKENKKRWEEMKKIYYADFDKEFIHFIDSKFNKNLRENEIGIS